MSRANRASRIASAMAPGVSCLYTPSILISTVLRWQVRTGPAEVRKMGAIGDPVKDRLVEFVISKDLPKGSDCQARAGPPKPEMAFRACGRRSSLDNFQRHPSGPWIFSSWTFLSLFKGGTDSMKKLI